MREPVLDSFAVQTVRPPGEVWTPAGMPPAEFVRRFGASCRTNHVIPLPVRRRAWAQLGWRIARNRIDLVDRRLHALPARSELPLEFIRLDPWEANYLFAVAAHAQVGIVEIGRLRGGSTFVLAAANQRVPIWSIDIAPEDDPQLRDLLDGHGLGANVELLVGNSRSDPFPEIGAFDLLFVDGDHSYRGCSADLHAFEPRLQPGGHLLLHDSYAGSQVQQAVLDYMADHELEIVRSPYIPSSHWHTSYGSVAHLTRRGRSDPGPRANATPPAQPAALAAGQRPVAAGNGPTARRAPSRRARVPAALALVAALLAAIFILLPEALGDWPYDPVGHTTKAHHLHQRA